MKSLPALAVAALACLGGVSLAQAPTPAAPGSSTNSVALDQETRELKPLDVLRFTILEDPAGRGQFPTVTISELGDAQFPVSVNSQEYVPVKAAGRRLADLRRELKQKLDADYYRNATVNLELLQTRDLSQGGRPGPAGNAKVIVHGSISATFPVREDQKLTVSEVFAQLSERSQFANLRKVELQRIDPATKQSKSTFINVKKLLDGDLSGDVELRDGDRLKVVDRSVIF